MGRLILRRQLTVKVPYAPTRGQYARHWSYWSHPYRMRDARVRDCMRKFGMNGPYEWVPEIGYCLDAVDNGCDPGRSARPKVVMGMDLAVSFDFAGLEQRILSYESDLNVRNGAIARMYRGGL